MAPGIDQSRLPIGSPVAKAVLKEFLGKSKKTGKPIVLVAAGWREDAGLWLRVAVHVVSEANTREHRAVAHKRHSVQKDAVKKALAPHTVPTSPSGQYVITLTRLSPATRQLDTDNLAGAFKYPRDEIARWLKIDDGSKSLTWNYAQMKQPACGIDIKVEPQ